MPTKPGSKKPLRISALAAGADPVHDPYVHKLELPKLPFKVEGDRGGGRMAMDDSGGTPFPYQGYLGEGGRGAFALYFPGYPYLSMLAQQTEYRQPVETHAKDMTREWIEFTSTSKAGKAKKIKQLEKRFRELNIQGLFKKALTHDGFFGVGHIFIDLKGKEDTELPVLLDPKSIGKGSLRGFSNIEPMWCTPIEWNSYDATKATFYVPDLWVALSKRCHKSRLLQVISKEVPDIIKPAYNFGGISLSQLIQAYVDRWLRTVGGVNRLINNFSLITLKTDMSGVLQGGDDHNIRRRMKMARQQGDNSGMFLIDMESEDLVQIAVPLSGLSELQAQSQEHMAMPTHEPLVVLTGITPAGLNASSDGEIEVYHDWNRSEQNAVMRRPLSHVMQVVMLDLWGEIDEEIDFEFVPIKQITGEALARIRKTNAESAQVYCDIGAVDGMEVRTQLAHDKDSGFVDLDVNKKPAPLEEDNDGGEDD